MNGRKFWDIKQSAGNTDEAELYIYGDIETDKYDWWLDDYIPGKNSADEIREKLNKIGTPGTLNIYINSFGGYCHEGHAVANMLRRYKGKTVAHIDGYACSVASVIACACDEVRMPKNTVMMIHNAWISGASGFSKDFRKLADDLDVQNSAFKTVYLEKAGGKLSPSALDKMLDEETYLTAEEAYKYGLCDVVEDYSKSVIEPDGAAKNSAKQRKIDVDRICAMLTAAPLQADNGGASGNEGGEAPENGEIPENAAPESAEPAPKEEETPETAEAGQQEAGTGQQEAGTGAEEPAEHFPEPKEKVENGEKPENKGSNADFSVKAENLLKKYLKL